MGHLKRLLVHGSQISFMIHWTSSTKVAIIISPIRLELLWRSEISFMIILWRFVWSIFFFPVGFWYLWSTFIRSDMIALAWTLSLKWADENKKQSQPIFNLNAGLSVNVDKVLWQITFSSWINLAGQNHRPFSILKCVFWLASIGHKVMDRLPGLLRIALSGIQRKSSLNGNKRRRRKKENVSNHDFIVRYFGLFVLRMRRIPDECMSMSHECWMRWFFVVPIYTESCQIV